MKKVLGIICAIVLCVTACISLCGCGEEKYTYWQISGRESNEVRLVYVSELSLSASSTGVTEVWVNISNLKPNSTVLTVVFANSSSTVKTLNLDVTADMIKKAKADEGWINLYFGEEIKCTKATVQAIDQMRINEIVFIKSDATMLTPLFGQGGVKVSSSGNSGNLYTKEQLDSISESDPAYNENPAYNIVDEQDRFPVSLIKTQK